MRGGSSRSQHWSWASHSWPFTTVRFRGDSPRITSLLDGLTALSWSWSKLRTGKLGLTLLTPRLTLGTVLGVFQDLAAL